MIAIAIDDEPVALEVVRSHASKVPFLELSATFTDAFQALDHLRKHPVDLIFLDIKMPDISGIEFYNSLARKPMVVFTTAYSEHAVTSFELDAVDYLLKPFSLPRFMKACTKAYEVYQWRSQGKQQDYIFLKTGYELVKVSFTDILYLVAEGNYINVVMQGSKLLTRMTFSEMESLLPPTSFIRIHRSYIVNKEKISRIERHQVTINREYIPISENYSQQIMLMR
jgi:DNA-binding LytR/AlgR family response regulator